MQFCQANPQYLAQCQPLQNSVNIIERDTTQLLATLRCQTPHQIYVSGLEATCNTFAAWLVPATSLLVWAAFWLTVTLMVSTCLWGRLTAMDQAYEIDGAFDGADAPLLADGSIQSTNSSRVVHNSAPPTAPTNARPYPPPAYDDARTLGSRRSLVFADDERPVPVSPREALRNSAALPMDTCPACRQRALSVCCVPCGHLSCFTCAHPSTIGAVAQCPQCRAPIESLILLEEAMS
jgi:hypothetical protein